MITHGPARVIALAASAGGVEALSRVIGALPSGLPAHVIALLHQAPEKPSYMVGILERCSSLPVSWSEDGAALAPGAVSVVPPGFHLLVAPGPTMRLIVAGSPPPNRPSADLLFATLATAVGARAVGVVLSGGGHDGATGATVLHAFGATVIATDLASSQDFSMPAATIARDHAVDHVVALDDVAALLCDVVAEPAGPQRPAPVSASASSEEPAA